MEPSRVQRILSPLLTIMFVTACAPALNPPTLPSQPTEIAGSPTTATEPPVTAEPTGSPAPEAGLCTNAYYPVSERATWTYASTGSSAGGYSFTDTITSVRQDGFTLSTQLGDLTRTQEWACRPEGLVALQLGGAPAALLNSQGMQLDFEITNASGVTFPSTINTGDQWQHNLDFEGSMSVAGEEAAATGNAQTIFTAIGDETVTVPAGTFEALKIQVDPMFRFNISYEGLNLPVTFSGTYTYWFAQGVGWVKATGRGSAAGMSFSETLELQSYSIP